MQQSDQGIATGRRGRKIVRCSRTFLGIQLHVVGFFDVALSRRSRWPHDSHASVQSLHPPPTFSEKRQFRYWGRRSSASIGAGSNRRPHPPHQRRKPKGAALRIGRTSKLVFRGRGTTHRMSREARTKTARCPRLRGNRRDSGASWPRCPTWTIFGAPRLSLDLLSPGRRRDSLRIIDFVFFMN